MEKLKTEEKEETEAVETFFAEGYPAGIETLESSEQTFIFDESEIPFVCGHVDLSAPALIEGPTKTIAAYPEYLEEEGHACFLAEIFLCLSKLLGVNSYFTRQQQ